MKNEKVQLTHIALPMQHSNAALASCLPYLVIDSIVPEEGGLERGRRRGDSCQITGHIIGGATKSRLRKNCICDVIGVKITNTTGYSAHHHLH